MTISKLDQIYRSIVLSKYFIKGWGSAENLKRLLQFRKYFSSRERCINLLDEEYPIEITRDEIEGNTRIIEGRFVSPFNDYLPSLLPKESKHAYFQVILPRRWESGEHRPVCMHFAGTGDHFFWRRRNLMARPLLREAGIGAILLENPFYGSRKPRLQVRSVLHNVSDIFVMGACLILEGLVLLRWADREGLGPLGVTGMSMGGHMASLVASNWPRPLVLVPCLSASTASSVFTEGIMSRAINWDMLGSQYRQDEAFRTDITGMIHAFQAGQEFAKNFPESIKELKDKDGGMLLDFKQTNKNTLPSKEQSKSHYVKPLIPQENDIDNNVINIKSPLMYSRLSHFKTTLGKVFSSFIQNDYRDYEALNFMRGIMDECTHLKNFSVPVDTSLIICVCARDDAYVPCGDVSRLAEIWPGAEVRYINAGHVSGFLLYQKHFRRAIIEAFNRYRDKYTKQKVVAN